MNRFPVEEGSQLDRELFDHLNPGRCPGLFDFAPLELKFIENRDKQDTKKAPTG